MIASSRSPNRHKCCPHLPPASSPAPLQFVISAHKRKEMRKETLQRNFGKNRRDFAKSKAIKLQMSLAPAEGNQLCC